MPLLLRGFVGKVVIDEADVEDAVGSADDVEYIGFALGGGCFNNCNCPAGRAVKLENFKLLDFAETFDGVVELCVIESDDDAGIIHGASLGLRLPFHSKSPYATVVAVERNRPETPMG